MFGVVDAGAESVGGGAHDDLHAAVDVCRHGVEHLRAFVLVETRYFAGDAECGEAGYAAVNEAVDDALQAVEVEVAV